MRIDEQRLKADIERNGSFGGVDIAEGRGRTVFTGRQADGRARNYFVERLEEAGLAVEVDAVGNIVGRWNPQSADPKVAPVAAGSHLDSVPEGGIFDGPLGVYAALEAVRAMQEAGVEPTRPIEVVSFAEEEGSQFEPLLGSAVATGDLPVENALERTDDEGTTLRAALEDIGYHGEGRLNASEWDAWFELHVEQGPRLENQNVPVGVVTDITGITHCRAIIEGEANHAGTTSMADRTDALAAAAEFVLDVEQAVNDRVAAGDEEAVGTVGKLSVRPNGTNVVPGAVELGLDVRDVRYESMNQMVRSARESLGRLERERAVETEFDRFFDLRPTPMSNRCRKRLRAAATAAGIEAVDLHSGAGHDTMLVADVTDVGMVFTPSRDGISHSPFEWTEWADCAAAAEVLARAMADAAAT